MFGIISYAQKRILLYFFNAFSNNLLFSISLYLLNIIYFGISKMTTHLEPALTENLDEVAFKQLLDLQAANNNAEDIALSNIKRVIFLYPILNQKS